MELLIFCKNLTKRKKYVFDLVFTTHLGVKYDVTENKELFLQSQQIKLSYGTFFEDNAVLFIPETGLLDESTIENVAETQFIPQVSDIKNLPDNLIQDNRIAFDFFAFVFYLVTRYEEYLTEKKDIHGRFPYQESIAYRYGFLDRPLIDECIIQIGAYLGLNRIKNGYKTILTCDVDHPWKYKNQPIALHLKKTLKNLLTLNFTGIREIINVCAGKSGDPFDTYAYFNDYSERTGNELIYFYPLGDQTRYDKNIKWSNKAFQKLIAKNAVTARTGIHFSYYSCDSEPTIKDEAGRYRQLTGREPDSSRQHYLRMTIPATYRLLAKSGIREEYSLGYAGHAGFRASTSNPFEWFDLGINEQPGMMIYPLAVMDVTLKDYMKLTPVQAISYVNEIQNRIAQVNGYFVLLWHNSSFDPGEGWNKWKDVFDAIVDYKPNY